MRRIDEPARIEITDKGRKAADLLADRAGYESGLGADHMTDTLLRIDIKRIDAELAAL